jgi:hypothetical protein
VDGYAIRQFARTCHSAILLHDRVACMVCSVCTKENLKAYKSLEAYNYVLMQLCCNGLCSCLQLNAVIGG